jgi:hypothetical protein
VAVVFFRRPDESWRQIQPAAPGKHSIQSALRPTLRHWIRDKKSADFKWCLKYGTERSESILKACYPQVSGFIMISMTQTGYKIKGDATFEKNCPMEKAALETHPLGSFDQQRQPCLGSKVFSKCLVLVFMCGFPPIPASRLAPRLAKYMVSMLRLR